MQRAQRKRWEERKVTPSSILAELVHERYQEAVRRRIYPPFSHYHNIKDYTSKIISLLTDVIEDELVRGNTVNLGSIGILRVVETPHERGEMRRSLRWIRPRQDGSISLPLSGGYMQRQLVFKFRSSFSKRVHAKKAGYTVQPRRKDGMWDRLAKRARETKAVKHVQKHKKLQAAGLLRTTA